MSAMKRGRRSTCHLTPASVVAANGEMISAMSRVEDEFGGSGEGVVAVVGGDKTLAHPNPTR